MAHPGAKHVFISYVNENAVQVDGLCALLDAAQIPYWRDRNSLGPGGTWKSEIREAIRSGAVFFLACFSEQSTARPKSYMNEELTLAVEEFRKMPPGHTWLIPIRFDDSDVPEWDLGAGRTISDLNWVDLFGEKYAVQASSLIGTLGRAIGESNSRPATVGASVREADTDQRRIMLRRLTKEMVRDTSRVIEMNDLISEEVDHVIAALRDTARFPTEALPEVENARIREMARIAEDYRQLIEPFCWSLQVAARWAETSNLSPWSDGLRAIYNEAVEPRSGAKHMLDMRKIPAMYATFVAALSCTGQDSWQNMKSLLVDNLIDDQQRETKKLFLDVSSPYEPFENSPTLLTHVLARSARNEQSIEDALLEFVNNKQGHYHTPVAEWLYGSLHTLFNEQFKDEPTYGSQFDRTEAMLGIISQDAANVAAGDHPDRAWRRQSLWFGRSAYRFRRYRNPVEDFAGEILAQGTEWAPLRAGLFGGSFERADTAIAEYNAQLKRFNYF
ncbi:toll/interleukin-1 receptor domain-containing protein [Nocardia salmonicida]|uniref:toll/interleukin-1 receptor domain-containing protein n=1 Tax=Nocardia salmonicida TaxID=53431 RepID=UPI003691B363